MNELLSNPAIQTAIVTVIVVALTAFTNWLKAKFPTQAKLVEANWSYLQPLVDGAMSAATSAKFNSNLTVATAENIVRQALTQFADDYRKFEGKDAPDKALTAAQAEITAAVARVTTGG